MLSQQPHKTLDIINYLTQYTSIYPGDLLLTGNYHAENSPFVEIDDVVCANLLSNFKQIANVQATIVEKKRKNKENLNNIEISSDDKEKLQ